MATYLILNLLFMAFIWAAFHLKPQRPSRAWIIALIGLIVLTVVFDNLLIWLGMFGYAPDKILGLRVGIAPIEDFMYPLLAAVLVPTVWNKLGAKNDQQS